MKSIQNLPLILLICFLGIEIFTINYFYSHFRNKEKNEKKIYLAQNLNKVTKTLDSELDKLSILVSGLRSYIKHSESEPTPEQIRKFLNDQLDFLEYSENIIINYIDTDHKFVYSIGTKTEKVNDLAGTSVLDIRKMDVIKKLNDLLKSDDILAFLPLNLYEGYVGLPIDFRHKHGNEVKGYFAIIIDVRSLLTPIIDSDLNEEFSFRFTAGEKEIEFDRFQVYDGTKSYSKQSTKPKLEIDNSAFIFHKIGLLGLPISIGMAFKENYSNFGFREFIHSILGLLLLTMIGTSLLLYYYYQNVLQTRKEKVINKELSKSNSLLTKFIYASSHDLKQPLVNISNFHNLLSKKHSDQFDSKANKYMDVIRDNIDHMSNLLDDLLVYSGVINRDKVKNEVQVNEVLDLIIQPYDKTKIQITRKNIFPCYGIKSEISRCFQNLISNSIKYNENDIVKILITGKISKKHIIYEVIDNGIGIKAEHSEIVFSEFQRIDKFKYPGSGLGLSICKEIVANHGGEIRAKDRPEGGTIITFSILKND